MKPVAAPLLGDESELREMIQRHKVCFETYPIVHFRTVGGRIAVGYELDLIGTPAGGEACRGVEREVRRVTAALLAIARAILPAGARASRYRIESDGVAVHFTPRRKMREDIIIAINIVHRGQFDRGIDDCETRCLREMQQKLKALGARPERW